MGYDKLNTKEQIDFILNKSKKLVELQTQKEEDIVTESKVHLPSEIIPVTNLSLLGEESNQTKESLLEKFKVDPEKYSLPNLTQDKVKNIKKSLGRMTTGASASVPLTCKGEACSYKERCLTGDTLILTSCFSNKPLRDIQVGDKIYSADSEYKLKKKRVVNKICNGIKTTYKIETSTGKFLTLTSNHQIAVYRDDEVFWMSLDEGLHIGHRILTVEDLTSTYVLDSFNDFLVEEIVNIEEYGLEEVFDIEVEDNHNFIANNILVHNCEFFKNNVHVVGEPCLAETFVAEYWTQKYMEELDIDPNSITEVHTVSRLVELSILENRLTMYMSIHEPDLYMDVVTAVDERGVEITNRASSIAFEQRERLDRSKLKILESLAATREKKAKIKISAEQAGSTGSTISSVRRSIDELAESIKKMNDIKTVN